MSADTTTPATGDVVTLDPENPWLGLFSYTEATRAYFHGRDEETAELARRVQSKNLTILFGQSGLGKTSLLRAGLVPRLRPLGFCPVYVRIDYAPTSPAPAQQIRQAIFKATTAAGVWTRPGSSAAGESLWELLHHRGDLLRDAAGKPLLPLLIFDQFEEIFTLGQADDTGRDRAKEFLADLADLVENRPPEAFERRLDADDALADEFDFERADYRVLITLREDYLAYLESLKGTMPSITQNRMRLARMTGAQALDAVVQPGGELVTREVAEAIVRFVAGGSELANAEIEPSLLSLVCRELNTARLAQHRPEISADLLAGSRDTILTEFYERSLADQPEGVRRVVEDELLTDSGYRESMAEERVHKLLADAGAAPATLATLVNRRLLRIEERLDMRRVELTHDVLCGVVLKSRSARQEREARAAAERQLAEQREREAAVHRTLVRTRLVATVCVVLLVLAILAAIFGFVGMHRATTAEAQAKTAEAQAQATRAHAESLVGFMTGDLYTELAPTGQTALLGTLARKTVDYYDQLPASQVTRQTESARALALVRLGRSQQAGGQFVAGAKSLAAAKAAFEKLRAAGDRSDDVTYGLALALYYQGQALVGNVNTKAAFQQAAALLQPLARGPHPARRVRQAYANVLIDLSSFQAPAAALAGLNEARQLLAGLGALDLSDLTAATSYSLASSQATGALVVLGQTARALQLARQADALAAQVLARRPGDLHALAARFSASNSLVIAAEYAHDLPAAAGYAAEEVQAGQAWVRSDPSSFNAWGSLSDAFQDTGYTKFQLGDVAGALAALQSGIALADAAGAPRALTAFTSSQTLALAQLQANAGAAAAAARSNRLGMRQSIAGLHSLAADDPVRKLLGPEGGIQDAALQLAAGAPQAAFAAASAGVARTRAVAAPMSNSDAYNVKTSALNSGLATAATAALQLGRYPPAAALARERLTLLRQYAVSPLGVAGVQSTLWFTGVGLSLIPSVEIPQAATTLAHALALQGQRAAAVQTLQPALAYYAKEKQAGARGTTFRHDDAYALYVSAIAAPADAAGRRQRAAALKAAAAEIAGASQQAQQLVSMRRVAAWIAEARAHP